MVRPSSTSRSSVVALTLGLLPGLAASGLADPTRPPGAAVATEPGGTAAPRAPAAATPAPPPAEPQLQSLQLPRDGAPSALVDGQLLRAGQRWNAFEIVAIDAQGVLAKGPGGPQRWTLVGVQYLDPKARPRPVAPMPAQAAAPASGSALSNVPPRDTPMPLRTAQWQFTPAAAPAALPSLPPVTRLSWADLVAPAPRTAPPQASAAARTSTPSRGAPPSAAVVRWPSAPVGQMPAAAGPTRPSAALAQATARHAPASAWRGLRFEWPAPGEAGRRPSPTRVTTARGPLRGPMPPSVVVARRPTGAPAGLVRVAGPLGPDAAREWWTPAPPPAAARTRIATATPAARHLPAASVRLAVRAAPRPSPTAPQVAWTPLPSALPRTPGPRLAGVVALNKESP